MLTLIEFIKQYTGRRNATTKVFLEWYWVDSGIDEEYCFEGSPDEFVEHYSKDYDCIDGFDFFDVHELKIVNDGIRSRIFIEIVRE